MKLYAVTIKAGMIIDDLQYKKLRPVPISKAAFIRPDRRVDLDIKYAPAVYTSKTNAFKLIAKLPQHLRANYEITEFDSGWVDYPEPA